MNARGVWEKYNKLTLRKIREIYQILNYKPPRKFSVHNMLCNCHNNDSAPQETTYQRQKYSSITEHSSSTPTLIFRNPNTSNFQTSLVHPQQFLFHMLKTNKNTKQRIQKSTSTDV